MNDVDAISDIRKNKSMQLQLQLVKLEIIKYAAAISEIRNNKVCGC